MLKITIGILLLAALCSADVPRYRNIKRSQNIRKFARQEVPAPAPTGYPAAGVTPEVPFELPSATDKPDSTYLPPDNTYLPPAGAAVDPDVTYGPPDAVYGPPENAPAPAPTPTLAPGNPDSTDVSVEEAPLDEEDPVVPAIVEQSPPPLQVGKEDEVLIELEDGTVIAIANSFNKDNEDQNQPIPARLVYQRFPQGRRMPAPAPARFVQLRPMTITAPAPAKLQILQQQPQPQSFAYTSRFESW